jgi:hypothetical protein
MWAAADTRARSQGWIRCARSSRSQVRPAPKIRLALAIRAATLVASATVVSPDPWDRSSPFLVGSLVVAGVVAVVLARGSAAALASCFS